jgi:hypothetical protein
LPSGVITSAVLGPLSYSYNEVLEMAQEMLLMYFVRWYTEMGARGGDGGVADLKATHLPFEDFSHSCKNIALLLVRRPFRMWRTCISHTTALSPMPVRHADEDDGLWPGFRTYTAVCLPQTRPEHVRKTMIWRAFDMALPQ